MSFKSDIIGALTLTFSTLAFFTNVFVIVVLIWYRRKMTPLLGTILNLLILDGTFALFGATFRAPGMFKSDFYQMNDVMKWLCPMLPLFITWVPPQCSLAILFITFDRFVAILYPFHYKSYLTLNRVWLISLSFWVFMFLKCIVEVTLIYGKNTGDILSISYDPDRRRCMLSSELYDFLIHTIFFFVPFLLMVVMYIIIISRILRQIQHKDTTKMTTTDNRTTGHQGFRTRRMFFTTSLITVGFFVTWFPYYVTLTERVVFGVVRPGFIGTVVMFYFNLWWDSVIYALRTPLVYDLVRRWVRRGRVGWRSSDPGSSAVTAVSHVARDKVGHVTVHTKRESGDMGETEA